VRDLVKADFQVLDDGVATPIQDFYAGNSQVSLALLLDISGSMGVGGNMDRARAAVKSVLASMTSQGDEAALYTFDSKLVGGVVRPNSIDPAQSTGWPPWGTTSL
jgi:hypothetical protein